MELKSRSSHIASMVSYIIVGIMVVAQMVMQVQVKHVIECQQEFAAQQVQVTRERSEASEADRKAFDNLLETIINPASTSDQRRKAIVDYRGTRKAADIQRAQNPFTEVKEVC